MNNKHTWGSPQIEFLRVRKGLWSSRVRVRVRVRIRARARAGASARVRVRLLKDPSKGLGL